VVNGQASAPKYPPNTRLSWQRLQRGWSREELVEQIKRSMAAGGESEPGLNAETVRRWEVGYRWPEPRYRKHLVLVFGMAASDLGLLTADELALRPEPLATLAPNRPGSSAVEAIVRKVMLVLYGDGATFDRAQPKGLLGASVAPLVSYGLATPADVEALDSEPRTRLDIRAVDAYAEITVSHRALYWQGTAAELLPSVAAHTQLGAAMLRSATGGEDAVRRLAGALSQSALLAARLAFFDLGQLDVAERAFNLAQDAIEAAQDHALAAAVMAHRAFVPGFAGNAQPAADYLHAAQAHARYDAGPLLRSWLHCVAGEIAARTGQSDTSQERIRAAEDALASTGHDPTWLDYFNPSRLAGFAGNALLLAGNHRAAATRLEASLNELDEGGHKQRAVLLFDLATAQASTDPAQALQTATEACDVLDADWYVTALDRVPAVRSALRTTPHGAELEDRVRALTRGNGD
jgi:hypothetical protein